FQEFLTHRYGQSPGQNRRLRQALFSSFFSAIPSHPVSGIIPRHKLYILLLSNLLCRRRNYVGMNLTKSRLSVYLPAAIAVTLTVSMIFFPEEAYSAAVKGVDVWWNIVFPALLPFFIGSEILMGLGVVHFLGVLLEP